MTDAREEWHYGDRYYVLTLASTPTSMDLELDEVGSREKGADGPVLLASCDDDTQDLALYVFTNEPLPIELIERFVAKAKDLLPGRA